MLPAGLSSAWRWSCRSWRYSAGRAVLDARDRLGTVTGPHLLDAEREHGPVLHRRRHGGQVQGRAPARARVVDVDDGRLVESGLAQPGLPAHAALVAQPTGHGVAHDDEAELVGGHAGVAERLVRRPRRPWCRAPGRAGSCRSCRCRGWRRRCRSCRAPRPATGCCVPANALRRSGEMLDGGRPGHHDDDVARPGLGIAAQGGGAGLGRTGHQVPLERLGRQAVQLREPRRRRRRAPRRRPRHRRRPRRRARRPRDRGRLRPSHAASAARAVAYSSGARKRGTQPSPTAAARAPGGRARAAEPQRNGGRQPAPGRSRGRRRRVRTRPPAARRHPRPSADPGGGSRRRRARTRAGGCRRPGRARSARPRAAGAAVACFATAAAGWRRGSCSTQVPSVGPARRDRRRQPGS